MHSYSFTNGSKGSLTFKDPHGIQHTLRRNDKFVIEVTSSAPIDSKIALQKAKKVFINRTEMLIVLRSMFSLSGMASANYHVISMIPAEVVPEVKVDSKIVIGDFSAVMRVHTTQKLDVHLEPESGEKIFYKSLNSRTVKVNDEGLVTSYGREGEAVISITAGEVSTEIRIQVIPAELQAELDCYDTKEEIEE